MNNNEILVAVEYGYRQCEKGKSLQDTLRHASELIHSKQPSYLERHAYRIGAHSYLDGTERYQGKVQRKAGKA